MPPSASAHRAQLKSNVFHLERRAAQRLPGHQAEPRRPDRPQPSGAAAGRQAGDRLPAERHCRSLVSSTRCCRRTRAGRSGSRPSDQDKLELNDIRVVDSGGTTVVVLGTDKVTRGRDVLAAPLVWVVDTLSDVGFTRGGDTVINRKGEWSVGFDALRSRSSGAAAQQHRQLRRDRAVGERRPVAGAPGHLRRAERQVASPRPPRPLRRHQGRRSGAGAARRRVRLRRPQVRDHGHPHGAPGTLRRERPDHRAEPHADPGADRDAHADPDSRADRDARPDADPGRHPDART